MPALFCPQAVAPLVLRSGRGRPNMADGLPACMGGMLKVEQGSLQCYRFKDWARSSVG
jgi:hypothetical protein